MLRISGIWPVVLMILLMPAGHICMNAQAGTQTVFQQLITKGDVFLDDREFDSAKTYLDAALKRALSTGDPCDQAVANRHFADYFQKKDELEAAPIFAETALRKASLCGDSVEIARCLNQAGGVYFRQNDYKNALDYFLEASAIAHREDKPELSLKALFYCGQIYLNQTKYPEAINSLEQGLSLFDKNNDDSRIGNFLIMLIRAYGQQYRGADSTGLRKGLEYFEKATALPDTQKSSVQARASKLYLSEYYVPIIGADSALRLIEQVIQASRPGTKSQAYAYKVQSQLWLLREQGPLAIASARQALSIAQPLGLRDIERSAWDVLHEALAYSGNYKEAYSAFEQYKNLEDSLLLQRMDTEVQDLQVQYKTQRILEQKQAVDKEIAFLKVRNRLAVVVALLLGFLLLLGMWFYFGLKRKNEIIKRQKAKLERANEAQNRLFAIIAHDLRGPFVSFQGLTQKLRWLQQKGRTDQMDTVTDHIGKTAHRLNILLDNLLAWSIEQREGTPYKAEIVSLSDEIEKQRGDFEPAFESKNQRLQINVPDSAQALVAPPVLATLLRNLFSNAIKFSPNESTIKVQTIDKPDHVILKIMDEGPGVSEEVQHRIFELDPDKRQSGSEGEKGAGIGLSLCKELALASGGDLTVDTRYIGGAAFDVRLPKSR